MKTLKVVNLWGNPCLLAPEKGDQLLAEIKNSFGLLSRSVEVDFSGYEFLSSAFLNRAFGQLCIDEKWTREKFHEKVKIKGLEEDDKEELELAIDNAAARLSLLKQGINPEEYFAARLSA